jgi:purine-binding chemotaxis protein CheW
VSLRSLLGFGEFKATQSTRAIVLAGTTPVALVVDGIETVISVMPEQIDTRQAHLAAEPGEVLLAAFQTQTKLGMAKILDVRALLDAAFDNRVKSKSKGAVLRKQELGVSEGPAAPRQILVSFDVNDQEYALDLEVVSEIVSLPESVVALPFSEAVVLGVTTFRDALLPLLSLRRLLGFEDASVRPTRRKVIVTAVKGVPVGLVADGVRAILRADPALVESTPQLLAARVGGEARVSAIYRAEGGERLVSILSPESLFRDEVMLKIKAEDGSKAPRELETKTAHAEELQFIVFSLADEEFCLPVGAVEEVAAIPSEITRIPKTPKFLEGIVNLRGDVLPVIDQRKRFDLPKFDGERRTQRVIVVKTGKHKAGLIVDSVSQLLRIPKEAIEPSPDLADDGTNLFQGVINIPNASRIIMVLDPEELLSRAERGLLDSFAGGKAAK